MQSILSLLPVLASTATAAVIVNANAAAVTGNPFSGYQLYANPYYASEVSTSALTSMTGAAKTAANKAARVPSAHWL